MPPTLQRRATARFYDRPQSPGQERTQIEQRIDKNRHRSPLFEKPPILGRGPRYASALLAQAQRTDRPGPKPTGDPFSVMTLPEWYTYWALLRLRKRPGVDFVYRTEQTYLSGKSGRTQLDFTMLDGSGTAMEVQGRFWHYDQGSAKMLQDYSRQKTLAPHYTIINLDEDDVLRDPEWYVKEALLGHDHSFRYRGYFVGDK